MPEEFDLANLDTSDPEAIKQLRAAYERQAAKAAEAEKGLAEARAVQRTAEVKNILGNLKAPGQLADLFPAEADVSEESVKTFLRDKVGFSPETTDAWGRYEQLGNRSEPPAPVPNEDEAWVAKEMQKTAEFYRRTNAPTDAEISELNELKSKVFQKLVEWDNDVSTGKMAPLVEPQGFGGFLDPPAYARRARHYVSQIS